MAFKKAQPVWLAGRTEDMNTAARLVARLPPITGTGTLRITASSLYRFSIDSDFGGFGPARAAHGYFRVDEWPLETFGAETELLIECVGYNINSYYWPMHPAFVQAEVEIDGRIAAATGGDGFLLTGWPERFQRVERYSAARTFSEAYRLGDTLRNDPERWEAVPQPRLLPRRVPYPTFDVKPLRRWVRRGRAASIQPEIYHRDWMLDCIGPDLLGYPEAQLEIIPSLDIQHYATVENHSIETAARAGAAVVQPLEFAIADFGSNRAGFIGAVIACAAPTTLFLTFDEILTEGDVDWKRLRCNNIIALVLQPGRHRFESIEPYALRYLKVLPVAAPCTIEALHIREYAAPVSVAAPGVLTEPEKTVFDAAVETFRQNAVDVPADCPSRERAGWLYDSLYTARTAFFLTRRCTLEAAFLENYRLHNQAKHLPAGMLPMCYPADHPNGKFIPNWALWYILQLEEYLGRTRDREERSRHIPVVDGVLEWFRGYVNEDGLLERLPGWVFVEWSRANDFVQDVNYPTNMLYAAALDAAGRMKTDARPAERAASIRQCVAGQSFDGRWFADHAVREDGLLRRRPDHTEVCQYYAFCFGAATPFTHPELWKTLVESFGPNRRKTGAFPEVAPANALGGMMMRMELLARFGQRERLRREIVSYYQPMAEQTGTLWEHSDTSASCSHGFASYIAVLLAENSRRAG